MDIIDIGTCEFCGGTELSMLFDLDTIVCRKIARAIQSLDDEFVDSILGADKTNSEKLSLIRHLLLFRDRLDNEHQPWAI